MEESLIFFINSIDEILTKNKTMAERITGMATKMVLKKLHVQSNLNDTHRALT